VQPEGSGDGPEQRGFSRAVRAEDGEDTVVRYVEIHTVQGVQ
jgi:hypothetical protein